MAIFNSYVKLPEGMSTGVWDIAAIYGYQCDIMEVS